MHSVFLDTIPFYRVHIIEMIDHTFSDGELLLSSLFVQIASMLNYTQPNSEVINIIGVVHKHSSLLLLICYNSPYFLNFVSSLTSHSFVI